MKTREYEYVVMQAESLSNLQDKVSRLIKQGWQPTGGVSHMPQENKPFVQAMVKSPPVKGTKETE